MIGVSRQLFVPLSLAVGFAMIASYLLSSSLVPVFATWLMRESHRGEGLFGRFGRSIRDTCELYCDSAGGSSGLSVYLRRIALHPPSAHGIQIFPDADAPVLRLRLRAPTGTRVEETERRVLRALDVIRNEIGQGNVSITSDFVGMSLPAIRWI